MTNALTRLRAITWHSFDLRSGRRGQQLDTAAQGTLTRALCAATDLTGHLVRLWDRGAPVTGWEEATLPGRTMLVALDVDSQDPVWGGMVLRRRTNASEWAAVDLVTLEAYFDRRYVGDRTFTATDQTLIAAGVIEETLTDGVELTIAAAPAGGLPPDDPIAVAGGVPLDRSYLEDDDKTVLSVVQELADPENGLEYTIDLAWVDETQTRLERILRLQPRIGAASAQPATFTMPGPVTDFEYLEDYSGENGANAVQANSTTGGDTGRLESSWWTAVGYGWAVFERKYTPATALEDQASLDAHAKGQLQQTWDGLTELTFTSRLDDAPQLGVDWALGDDIGVSLTCPRFPARHNADGDVVPGYQAVARATAWELDVDNQTIKPTITETVPVTPESL